jgi:hypothetical protein
MQTQETLLPEKPQNTQQDFNINRKGVSKNKPSDLEVFVV